jgi:hypothetical protein
LLSWDTFPGVANKISKINIVELVLMKRPPKGGFVIWRS